MRKEPPGFTTLNCRIFVSTLLLCCCLNSVEAQSVSRWTALREITQVYPSPSEELTSDPASSGILLVEGEITAPIDNVCGLSGVLLARTGEKVQFVRAAYIPQRHSGKGVRGFFAWIKPTNLVLFENLPPGKYAIQFLKGEKDKTQAYVVVESGTLPEIEIRAGVATYLGRINARVFYLNRKPPVVQLVYDPDHERAAWSFFREFYPESPWSRIVDERIATLQAAPLPTPR